LVGNKKIPLFDNIHINFNRSSPQKRYNAFPIMAQLVFSRIYMRQKICISLWLSFFLVSACSNNNRAQLPSEPIVISKPEQVDEKAAEVIQKMIREAIEKNGSFSDDVKLKQTVLLEKVYSANGYQPIWSKEEKWNEISDSLYNFIYFSKLYGLFPGDYNLAVLQKIRNSVILDSLHKKNINAWSKADILFTEAYLSIAQHLKLGRLPKDSITLRTDSAFSDEFFLKNLQQGVNEKRIRSTLESLEPTYPGYITIKNEIKHFLDSAVFRNYTYVYFPNRDTMSFNRQIIKRLAEQAFINKNTSPGDTLALESAIYRYQKQKGIKATGKAGEQTVRSLNYHDWERFKRISINLDRYKQLPDKLPEKYIWVNIPAYIMQLWDTDTLVLQSKVVVGKAITRTPQLNSRITDMITYPQWTIPTSIIVKEILPGLKRNPAYLQKRGYMLLNDKDEEVDPFQVNWEKYTRGIPYRVVQGSGDDNALGVIKFNFNNKYSVYMHDTNQRYYFKNSFRALSHGCVRVQEWQKLAYTIIESDSTAHLNDSIPFSRDSLNSWLTRKERHVIPIRKSIPVYFRYFTCEAIDGKMKFYDDIYGEDRVLSERYFANKPVY
jgi:L,D-transpeptidase YcbB